MTPCPLRQVYTNQYTLHLHLIIFKDIIYLKLCPNYEVNFPATYTLLLDVWNTHLNLKDIYN